MFRGSDKYALGGFKNQQPLCYQVDRIGTLPLLLLSAAYSAEMGHSLASLRLTAVVQLPRFFSRYY
jgi:hypothetical protein